MQLHVDVRSDRNLEQTAEGILSDTGLAEISYGLNMAYDSTTKQGIMKEVIPMIICMILVFVSGYLIIYNIFQISVSADIRFYGKLKTLGMTKKQLKKLIYGQANRLSLIGIPVGLLLGSLLGTVLVPMMITGLTRKATTSINLYVILGAAAFAYLTVLISCLRPARIAGKVSPMEALRYTDGGSGGKGKARKRRGGASISRMALANLGRNKKRTFTVICSLTLGLVLLTAIYAKNASFDIDKYMSQTVISDFEVADSSIASVFGVYNPYGTTISSDLVSRIEGLEGLKDSGYLYSQTFTHDIAEGALKNIETYYNTNERLEYIEATDGALAKSYDKMIETKSCLTVLYGADGLIMDSFADDYRLLEGTFDEEKFATGKYIMAEAASGAEESKKETQPTYSVGDMVEINGSSYEVMGIIAGAVTVREGLNSNTEEAFLSFYMPAETFREHYPDNTIRKIFFDVAEENQGQAEQMLIDYRQEVDKGLAYTSKATLEEHYREQTRSNTIMAFAISIIIALVGILNFINSMVTAIVSRQKEFAMIQSIGMTKRQLRQMLINEGLYYAGSTLAASYILGSLAVVTGVRMMVSTDWTATYHFTIMPLVICTPVLLAFAVLIPYLCFKNLEKQSIVERLRAAD